MPDAGHAGGKAPTIYDVADRAGVSSQTVVRFLNGFEGMTKKTQEKVRRAIADLDYRPNSIARALRTTSPRRILLFVHGLQHAGPANIVAATHSAAAAAGYGLEIVPLDVANVEAGRRLILETDPSLVAGALALAPTPEMERIFDALPKRIPLLREVNGDGLEGPRSQGPKDPGTRLVVEHLHHLGHRRLFLVEGPAGWSSSERRARTAIATAAELNMQVTGRRRGDWSAASGFAAIRDVQSLGGATAVVCANDDSALGAMLALSQLGLRIPEDVSVVGYDDISTAAYMNPPLTTVRVDFEMSGRIAVDRLIALMAERAGQEVQRTTEEPTPPRLIVRSSSGSAPDPSA